MASGTIHIIGAGLAGLSAAIALAGTRRQVVVHELARHAGGRCRSYFEPALGLTIDNGNHLLLSANRAALALLKRIGTEHKLVGPEEAEFAFADLASGDRWVLHPNRGRLPWWILSKARRVPGTRPLDYLPLVRLLGAHRDRTIGEVIECSGTLYERLWRPIFLAALNTDPSEASAQLAGGVLRETLARGGSACRPLIAMDGLGPAFIDPALTYLERQGTMMHFAHQLRKLNLTETRVRALDFGEDVVSLAPNDAVILAVPASVASLLVPELPTPTKFRAIVNAHFKTALPEKFPRLLGIVNGTAEWLFTFRDRLSVTISAADRFIEVPRDVLARKIWADVARLTGAGGELPPWQIVKERRATFAALPEENAKRPPSQTRWRNLFLAGDWTATGLPATIEGAIRSGNRAAHLVTRVPLEKS
jgi:hydroxysqualene dehydroxylase